jgi:DNA mismatch repair protein MutS
VTRALRSSAPHHLGPARAPARATVELDDAGDSPILRGYREVREEYPEAIVLVRLGDFYEMFGPDAEAGSSILGIALTGRGFGNAGRVPMCGVPHQSLAQHLRKLLDAGRHVVVWDQVGEAVSGKLVPREVTRVLSPGMVVEDELLQPTSAHRCVTVIDVNGRTGVAALDPSTGEMEVMQFAEPMGAAAVIDECAGLWPAELVFADGAEPPATLGRSASRTVLPLAFFDLQSADRRLREACGTTVLAALDIDDMPLARRAAGALLAYCDRSRILLPASLLRIRVRRPGQAMRLDAQTRRNLEITAPLGGGGASLVALTDRTCTAMGARLLRARLQDPLTSVAPLQSRLDAVAELVENGDVTGRIREVLRRIADLERLTARCVQGLAGPRDLGAVRDACAHIPALQSLLGELRAPEHVEAREQCLAPPLLQDRLDALLVDNPPSSSRDGGAIRAGADSELDAMLAASSNARSFIAGLEEQERRRTGIRSLRVGYNRVFGYYIEVPNAHGASVPGDYVRKQTLVGAERYITPDLKEQESIVLHARERSIAREVELVEDASALVAQHAAALLRCARALASLDVTQSLARAALEHRWTRPELDESTDLDIEAGRHPLVEHALGPGRFVPNDCSLDGESRMLVLTGPNMAGKSTYLRQVASIVLLAQVGSYVPARRARIGVCDRIFTRVGAHDDLSGGMSTFMVEMSETAAILRQASPRSLVILDEIGRGTSTYDGLSIAQAVVEHIHESPQLGCRTLFATHFHELTALAERLSHVRNARVEVVEEGDHVTFLHRIVPGGADRSYGVHVARLAGVPTSVLLRARQILGDLQRARPISVGDRASADQMNLPMALPPPQRVVEELAELDIDGLTPVAALNKLVELRQHARS